MTGLAAGETPCVGAPKEQIGGQVRLPMKLSGIQDRRRRPARAPGPLESRFDAAPKEKGRLATANTLRYKDRGTTMRLVVPFLLPAL